MGRTSRGLLGLALVGAMCGTVLAQDIRPDWAVKYRQSIMQAQSWNMRFLAPMVKGAQPYNKDKFLYYATALEQVSHMAWEGYTPGSGNVPQTRAKPEVWKEPATFKQMQNAFETATPRLVAAAKVGTLDAVKGPFDDVVKTCDNCHNEFRNK